MFLRQEFISLAQQPDSNVALLCERFGISRKTGYKWLGRCPRDSSADATGLEDRSRRPLTSPRQTGQNIEQIVCDLRRKHPAWGGRKIHVRLKTLGHQGVPAPSTITGILRRHQLLDSEQSLKHRPFVRFEHPNPNDLWQMDFARVSAVGTPR